MGLLMPVVHLGGRKIDVVPQANGYHESFKVTVPAGQGENIELTVTTGEQVSAPVVFHYERPTVTRMTPISSPTSGALPGASKRTVATITGDNFGVFNSTDVRVLFKMTTDKPSDQELIFVAEGQDILSIANHSTISFLLPPGYGSQIRVFVSVSGQVSATSLAFAYDSPRIDSILLDCSGYDDVLKDFVPDGRPCYGYRPAQFPETNNYARIRSISVSEAGQKTNWTSLC